MEFVAIDFETANANRASACSIGLVTVKDGKIIDEYYSLIKPKIMYFNKENIDIHGITPEMVKDAPNFEQIWPEIFKRLQGKQVVAHFAKFDMNVLRNVLHAYYLPLPTFNYICTWVLSKKAFLGLEHYSLDYVARHIGFKFEHHHALEDARACAAIMTEVINRNHPQDFVHIADMYDFEMGHMHRNGVHPCTMERTFQKKPDIKPLCFSE